MLGFTFAFRLCSACVHSTWRFGFDEVPRMHSGGQGFRHAKKEVEIESFFRRIYHSTAETLPHGLVRLDEECAPEITTSAEARKRLVEEIIDSACQGPFEQERRACPSGLTRRYLPPGKLSDLYLVYVASCTKGSCKAACAEHFRRVWRRGWDKVLLFRKRSTHALCKRCHQLKTLIKHSSTLHEHVAACDRSQYKRAHVNPQHQQVIKGINCFSWSALLLYPVGCEQTSMWYVVSKMGVLSIEFGVV